MVRKYSIIAISFLVLCAGCSHSKSDSMPQDEQSFVQTLNQLSEDFSNSDNGARHDQLVSEQKKKLAEFVCGGGQMNDWVGKLSKVTSELGSDKIDVEIQLSKHITLFEDGIPPHTGLYRWIRATKIGQPVIFTGTMNGENYRITASGGVTDPLIKVSLSLFSVIER